MGHVNKYFPDCLFDKSLAKKQNEITALYKGVVVKPVCLAINDFLLYIHSSSLFFQMCPLGNVGWFDLGLFFTSGKEDKNSKQLTDP
jgi:hypothetical protein